jgi:hypothetical protein
MAKKMAEILAKISTLRQRMADAIEDVPDTLIGMIVALLLLTLFGIAILMIFGYRITQ